MEGSRTHESRWALFTCVLLGLYVFVGGAVSFLGYPLDIRGLTDWMRSGISIQPNTTLAAACAGLSLLGYVGKVRGLSIFFASATFAIGFATLFQWVTRMSLGIDTLLLFDRSWADNKVVSPGRMGPPGTISWTLIGIALLLIHLPKQRFLTSLLPVVTASISALSVVGYMYGAEPLYVLPKATAIAFQTSTFILAASIAIMAALPDQGITRLLTDRGSAGILVRRIFPAAIIVAISLGFLRLKGEERGYFDTRFGSAVLVLALILMTMCFIAWAGAGIRHQEEVRRKADEALAENNRKVVETLESISEALMTMGPDWRYTYANSEAERFCRQPRSDLLGKTPLECFPHLAGTEIYANLEAAMEQRRPHTFEAYQGPTGRWFLTRLYPTPDGGLAIYFQDTTESKLIQERVMTTQAQLEAELKAMTKLQEVSTRLVVAGEFEPLLEEILSAAVSLSGTTRGNIQFFDTETSSLKLVVSRGLSGEFIAHFAENGCETTCDEAARTGRRVVIPDALQHFEGVESDDAKTIIAEGIRAIQCIPLMTRSGHLLGMLNVLHEEPRQPSDAEIRYLDLLARMAADFIERRSDQELLRRTNEELALADRRKDEFLATLSHELRNPLSPIRLSADLLKPKAEADEDIAWIRNMLDRQVKQMTHLLDDLLDVSRITRDKIQLRLEEVELASLIQSSVEAVRPIREKSDIEISTDLVSEPVRVQADPTRMAQVLGNLLTNAIKFTEPGGQVIVSLKKASGKAIIEVRDTGIGIEPDKQRSIFEMFGQVDASLDRTQGGLGIGLYLVRRIVELHGGDVCVQSAGLGHGSTFTVELPALASSGDASSEDRSAASLAG